MSRTLEFYIADSKMLAFEKSLKMAVWCVSINKLQVSFVSPHKARLQTELKLPMHERADETD